MYSVVPVTAVITVVPITVQQLSATGDYRCGCSSCAQCDKFVGEGTP